MLDLILITTIVAIIMYLVAPRRWAYSVKFKDTVIKLRAKKWLSTPQINRQKVLTRTFTR